MTIFLFLRKVMMARCTWETRPVELTLQLPDALADDVEVVREQNPELLSRVIEYGLTRRAMFEELYRSRNSLVAKS